MVRGSRSRNPGPGPERDPSLAAMPLGALSLRQMRLLDEARTRTIMMMVLSSMGGPGSKQATHLS